MKIDISCPPSCENWIFESFTFDLFHLEKTKSQSNNGVSWMIYSSNNLAFPNQRKTYWFVFNEVFLLKPSHDVILIGMQSVQLAITTCNDKNFLQPHANGYDYKIFSSLHQN